MPDFAPDGSSIVYRNPRGRTGIYVIELSSGASRLHLADAGRFLYFHPRWSPDGSRLALSRLDLETPAVGGHLISAIAVLR